MSNNENTLLGVIIGSAIGATLGILFAPEKGEITRKRIAEQAANTRDQLQEGAYELRDKMADQISAKSETLETKVNSIMSDVSYKTEDVITTLESKLAELKAKNKKLQQNKA
ncbi:YtxH domain-containing protein [Aggregatimonas sangjinii]|uniref:YtxH domain-containing protein n=1 Tax=Aggregatimonas sangjinii TaxID=2583587 RepID=A0A5B7STV2_9FLAO|nr:YtxH domain-containing protein [Aggregatimonas sangjinii]QCX01977.1 YtxH domain-containing protein [Aggregatimonas sangjinii]